MNFKARPSQLLPVKSLGMFPDMSAPLFPIKHDFVFERLSPDSKPNYQPYLKLTFFFKKRPDISHEDFHKHWQTVCLIFLPKTLRRVV